MTYKIEDVRSRPTTVRLTRTEHTQLAAQAEAAKISISEFLRRAALGRVIISKTDSSMIQELRRIGGLLKHIHNETKGVYSQETLATLNILKSAIERLSRDSQKG